MKRLKKTWRIQRRKKFRNVNLRALKDAGRILLLVFVKDLQSCQVKVNVWCKELTFLSKAMEGLLLYTSLDGVPGTMKVLGLLITKILDRFTVYLIQINCTYTMLLSKSPEKPFWKCKS